CAGSQYASSTWSVAVTDGQSNNWQQATIENQSTTEWAAIFYAQSTSGGTADAATLTVSGASASNQSIVCQFYELPGILWPSSALDQTTIGTNAGSTTPSAGSATPAGVNEFALTVVAAGTTATLTAGSNWVLDHTEAPSGGGLTAG